MFLDQSYTVANVEQKWQKYWIDQNIYRWDENKSREENFSIDTPPPTVSGLLHMGHIFSYTQTDFIARYQRMKGMNVFYPMGFDDNGLPTERLVEKIKNVRAHQMPRAEFITLCQETIKEAESEFRNLFTIIGLSVDWNQSYQTISSKSCTLSQMSFLDLYEKGHIYRDKAPTFWDSVDRTAISQTEIIDKEQKGVMNDIVFFGPNQEELVISTTRPELIPACVALFYHPNDLRYQHLKGQKATTPLFTQQVPIIPDEDVQIDKGTGLVMSCTFGDIQDIHWWKKHHLSIIDSINHDGIMDNSGFLNGMKVKEARNAIIEKLKESNLLKKQVEVTQFVKCAERSGAPLEILVTEQWYISVLNKTEEILQKSHECKWYPEYMRVRLDNWVNGLNQDWCISRQRYFGIPFPVWYSLRPEEDGKILLPHINQLPVDPNVDLPIGYKRHEVLADLDVMDTWATSAISPQLSTEWISQNMKISDDKHHKLYPFDLRPQAHEIIRVWAFGTIVKSMYHENSIPWKNLMISGWCLASDKTKMSKSKGNVITPQELILDKGSDAVRYWASTSKLGADTAYSEDAFKIGKRLITKLWNAAKFCSIHFSESELLQKKSDDVLKDSADKYNSQSFKNSKDSKNNSIHHINESFIKEHNTINISTSCLSPPNIALISETADIWILAILSTVIDKATKALEEFEYCDARVSAENFFWLFCDHYLELVKYRLYNCKDNQKGQSAIITLFYCLVNIIKLMAPFLPHVTEEIYQGIFKQFYNVNSIHSLGTWPNLQEIDISQTLWCNEYISQNDAINKDDKIKVAKDFAINLGTNTVELLDLVRKFKSQNNLSLKVEIETLSMFTKESLYLNENSFNESILFDLKKAANAVHIQQIQNINEHVGDIFQNNDEKCSIGIKLK